MFLGLGFRLDTIFPADDPSVALLTGHDARVRLVRVGADAGLDPDAIPALRPSFVLTRANATAWRTGRAGMLYRDLIPDRQGGRYVASHIRIIHGGPVPDYVHFHAIQFQIIYCYKGWVRVVYEDQGDPFVMQAGECVLQPPRVRHRVLEASPGLEVIEIGAPAIHATHVDHDLALPTATTRADRELGGQRFVRYRPGAASFTAAPIPGFEGCDLGIAAATGGTAAVHLLRPLQARAPGGVACRHDAELLLHIVLRGNLTLDDVHALGPADAFVVPAGRPWTWGHASADLELLQVAAPAKLAFDCAAR